MGNRALILVSLTMNSFSEENHFRKTIMGSRRNNYFKFLFFYFVVDAKDVKNLFALFTSHDINIL